MAAVKKQSEGLRREYDHLMKEYERLQVGSSGSLCEPGVLNCAAKFCLLAIYHAKNLPRPLVQHEMGSTH